MSETLVYLRRLLRLLRAGDGGAKVGCTVMSTRVRVKEYRVEELTAYRQCQLCHAGVRKGEQYVIGRGIYAGTVCMDCARLIAGAMK